VPYRIPHGFRQVGRAGNPFDMVEQPPMEGLDDRSTSLVSDPAPVFGGVAPDLGLDRIERGNAGQHLGGQRRLRRRMELEELATHVDHPNAIYGLRFTVPARFCASRATPRRPRAAAAG
jgi:hypothetical protein